MAVQLRYEGRVARMVLDRPPLNILGLAALGELDERLEGLAADASVQLVVLEGAGARAFSAGVAVEDHAAEKIEAMLSTFHRAVRRLRDLPAITLAVVHGHCLGGGCELATACDFVLAAQEATFGLPEVELGCFPPVAAALYPRRLGRDRALELLLTGRRFDGKEALELGLATWTVPAAELASARDEQIQRLTRHSTATGKWIKKAVRAAEGTRFDEALAQGEAIYLQDLAATEDMSEGLAAFLEKRPPRWRHR